MNWERVRKGYYRSGKYMIYNRMNWWYVHKQMEHELDKIYERWEYLSMHPTLKAAQFWMKQQPKE